MDTRPIHDDEADGASAGWTPIYRPCTNCGKRGAVVIRIEECPSVGDGDAEDIRFRCRECGHSWWLDDPQPCEMTDAKPLLRLLQ
jgi:hypothetical protein